MILQNSSCRFLGRASVCSDQILAFLHGIFDVPKNTKKCLSVFLVFKIFLPERITKIVNSTGDSLIDRDVAQSGSAPGLGPGGPRFESWYPDKRKATQMSGFFVFGLDEQCLH